MANGTPWKVEDRWTTKNGVKVIKYENGYWEANGTIYPTVEALRDAIGSTLQR